MIILTASKSCLTASRRELLVEGAVNVNIVQFVFSSDWDGLTKTAVFQAGSDKYSVLLDESNEAPIPWEVLQNPRRTLYAGVYGTNGESLVLPTIWASLGTIQEGVNPGQDTQPPTPDVYSQILQVAKDAEDVAQSVRDDADRGKFNGEQGPTGPQGYTYTPAVSEEGVISWTNDGSLPNPSPVNIKGPQGKQGIQGVQGKQGERGYVYTPNVSQDGIISWTNDGDLENPDPVDIRGPEGPQGGQGEQGIQGPRGYTYTPSVGEDGTVSWTNDGNLPNPDPVNITGPQGETGETPDITAGTVETLEPGQDATAEITGETPNLVLNLGIPKGQPGQDAPQIDDDVVSATNPWSSLKIVDTLAPPFSSSGAIVTCNPVAGYPLHVVSQIMPVQEGSGDPSPENVRPISGWTEANLWVGGANLFRKDNVMLGIKTLFSGLYGGKVSLSRNHPDYAVFQMPIKPGQTCYFYNPQYQKYWLSRIILLNPDAMIGYQHIRLYSSSDRNFESYKFTFIDAPADSMLIQFTKVDGSEFTQDDVDALTTTIGFGEIKEDAISYNHASRTITLPFGQTVYGGTLDWQSGVLTITYAMADMSTFNWAHYTDHTNVYGFFCMPPNAANCSYNLAKSNKLRYFSTAASGVEGFGNGDSSNRLYVYINKTRLPDNTVDSFEAFLTENPITFVYLLASPTTVQLTPQEMLALSGENTIYTDTGDTTASGRADPNTILQQLAQRIAALEGQAING